MTDGGKRRSRQNAVRHGLTAETIIGALEDAEDYAAFAATTVLDIVTVLTVIKETLDDGETS